MTTPLNAMQLKMLEIYSEGDFAWLSVHDSETAIEKAKSSDVGDLMLAYLLADLDDAETPEEAADRLQSSADAMTAVAIALDTLR